MTLKITARQLETAAQRFLVKCAAAQPRSLEGTLSDPSSFIATAHKELQAFYTEKGGF